MRTPPQGRPVAITGHISQPITITVRTDGRWRAVSHHCLHGWSVAIAAHFFVCPAAQSTGHIYPPLLVDRTGHGPHQIGLQHHLTSRFGRQPRSPAAYRRTAPPPLGAPSPNCLQPFTRARATVLAEKGRASCFVCSTKREATRHWAGGDHVPSSVSLDRTTPSCHGYPTHDEAADLSRRFIRYSVSRGYVLPFTQASTSHVAVQLA
jgi:hypothetical protein